MKKQYVDLSKQYADLLQEYESLNAKVGEVEMQHSQIIEAIKTQHAKTIMEYLRFIDWEKFNQTLAVASLSSCVECNAKDEELNDEPDERVDVEDFPPCVERETNGEKCNCNYCNFDGDCPDCPFLETPETPPEIVECNVKAENVECPEDDNDDISQQKTM